MLANKQLVLAESSIVNIIGVEGGREAKHRNDQDCSFILAELSAKRQCATNADCRLAGWHNALK